MIKGNGFLLLSNSAFLAPTFCGGFFYIWLNLQTNFMRKTAFTIVLTLFCTFFANAQSKPLVFDGSEIGYFNESGIPVVTTNLTKEQADAFRLEYKKFIYLPKSQRALASDIPLTDDLPQQLYDDEVSSGKLIKRAGVLYNLSSTIGISGGLIGSLLISEGEIRAAGITTTLSSITALILQYKANAVLIEAGNKLENEISSLKSIHLKSDTK